MDSQALFGVRYCAYWADDTLRRENNKPFAALSMLGDLVTLKMIIVEYRYGSHKME